MGWGAAPPARENPYEAFGSGAPSAQHSPPPQPQSVSISMGTHRLQPELDPSVRAMTRTHISTPNRIVSKENRCLIYIYIYMETAQWLMCRPLTQGVHGSSLDGNTPLLIEVRLVPLGPRGFPWNGAGEN